MAESGPAMNATTPPRPRRWIAPLTWAIGLLSLAAMLAAGIVPHPLRVPFGALVLAGPASLLAADDAPPGAPHSRLVPAAVALYSAFVAWLLQRPEFLAAL